MKAKITNPRRAVEIIIEGGGRQGAGVDLELDRCQQYGYRDPYLRTMQTVGFNYNMEWELTPETRIVRKKEVMEKWISEKIIVLLDDGEEQEETPEVEGVEEIKVEEIKKGQPLQKGTIWTGGIKLNNSAHAPIEARIWWNGKFYQEGTEVYLNIYHGDRGQAKIVLSPDGVKEDKMARSDCHLAAANKEVLEILQGRLVSMII